MSTGARQVLPHARTAQLVVQELPDEVLVYDLDRHKAHCLNKTSAIVWKHCDGETTVAEMAGLLKKEFGAPVGQDVVWLALSQLRKFHLIEGESVSFGRFKVSRRDLVMKYLPAALVLPAVLTISSPTAVQAASGCGVTEDSCGGVNDPPCCAGFACNLGFGICLPT